MAYAMIAFGASWAGMSLLDALFSYVKGGSGKYKVLKVWEAQTITDLGMAESEWVKFSLRERARKIVANKIDGWFASLEMQKQQDEMRVRARS